MGAGTLRWQLADDEQPRLFDVPEREIGIGEFRGLEFLHVRARTIINRVDARSPVPFGYTINAYRGCSHACSYCMWGETPILMADGRTKPLGDVRVGDRVYGTLRRGRYRRYVNTEVLDHWATVKPAYGITLEDGTRLITSRNHRFLTERGWKHVTGRECGRLRRAHLTTNNKLTGTGHFSSAPFEDADYRRGYLCGLVRGDGHLGHYSYPRSGRSRGDVHRFRLALVDLEALRRARIYLQRSDISTEEFAFQEAVGERRALRAIRTSARAGVFAIERTIEWPAHPLEPVAQGIPRRNLRRRRQLPRQPADLEYRYRHCRSSRRVPARVRFSVCSRDRPPRPAPLLHPAARWAS